MIYLKYFFIYLFFSITTLISYIYLSNFWILCPEQSITQFYIELPILIILLFLLYFPIKSIFKSTLLATTPILLSYALFDSFYFFLKRSPRLSDFKNTFLVFDFSILFSILLILAIISIIFPIILLVKSFTKKAQKLSFLELYLSN